jgi:hypothetical protein
MGMRLLQNSLLVLFRSADVRVTDKHLQPERHRLPAKLWATRSTFRRTGLAQGAKPANNQFYLLRRRNVKPCFHGSFLNEP